MRLKSHLYHDGAVSFVCFFLFFSRKRCTTSLDRATLWQRTKTVFLVQFSACDTGAEMFLLFVFLVWPWQQTQASERLLVFVNLNNDCPVFQIMNMTQKISLIQEGPRPRGFSCRTHNNHAFHRLFNKIVLSLRRRDLIRNWVNSGWDSLNWFLFSTISSQSNVQDVPVVLNTRVEKKMCANSKFGFYFASKVKKSANNNLRFNELLAKMLLFFSHPSPSESAAHKLYPESASKSSTKNKIGHKRPPHSPFCMGGGGGGGSMGWGWVTHQLGVGFTCLCPGGMTYSGRVICL